MEIIPTGGDCFPGKREGAAGVRWARVFGGSRGQGHPLGAQGERGRVPASAPSLPAKGHGTHPAPGMRQTAPSLVPPAPPTAPQPPPPAPRPPWGQILGAWCCGVSQELPRGARGCRGGRDLCPHACPLRRLGRRHGGLLAISYSSRVPPGGGRAAAGAPKWLQSVALRPDRRGSGAAAGSGSRLPDKGPGTKARLPRAPGKGRRRVRAVGASPAWGLPLPPVPAVPRCPPGPRSGWHGRGALGHRVARCWHWSHATPRAGAVPGTALGTGLCPGPSPALHPQRCPPRGAVGLGWGAVGHGATRRGQKAWMGPQQRIANTRQVAPVPTCLSFPSRCWGPLCPVSPPQSLSPWPGHSPAHATFVPAPCSWLQTHRPHGSCHLRRSTGLGTPPVPPGAAGAVPTHGVPGGLWGTMPNGTRPPKGRGGTWPPPHGTRVARGGVCRQQGGRGLSKHLLFL